MKLRYLALIPLFLFLGDTGEPATYSFSWDSHPPFTARYYENKSRVECYEDGVPGVAMRLESSFGDDVLDDQILKGGSCSQCHPSERPVRLKELLAFAEELP